MRTSGRHRPSTSLLTTPSPPSWTFVDRFGTAWMLFDRIRWAPTPDRAEFRSVPPGHRDVRSRLFVRADRVTFEVRRDDPSWRRARPNDLSDRTLDRLLRAARRLGPIYLPRSAATTLDLEMRRYARDYARPAVVAPADGPREVASNDTRTLVTTPLPAEVAAWRRTLDCTSCRPRWGASDVDTSPDHRTVSV